jgi:excisionase family DNA binding protein
MSSQQSRTVLTVEELAERWQVNVKTIYAAIAAGEVPVLRIGRVLRIPLAAVLSAEQASAVPTGG